MEYTQAGCLSGINWYLKRNAHMALRAKIIDFVRLHFGNNIGYGSWVGEVTGV